MKAISQGFVFVVALITAGCGGDPGTFDGEEPVESTEEALSANCSWLYVQTGQTCDYPDPQYWGGQVFIGPPTCWPEYGWIVVCQDPAQYCTNRCRPNCESCSPGPGRPTCINACMNHCVPGCMASL
jgi:hypothetical protein